jgi:lysophospholipase L1-like esterase
MLRARLQAICPDYVVVNAGINGQHAYNIFHRIDEVIACKPQWVCLMVGTNDWKGIFNPVWGEAGVIPHNLPQVPTEQWYVSNMRATIQRLLDSDQALQVAVLELPPMGEDLLSRANRLVDHANQVLSDLVADFSESKRVTLVATNKALKEHISSRAGSPCGTLPVPFESCFDIMGKAYAKYFLLMQSWDTIGRSYGYHVLCDGIHLNDTGGQVVVSCLMELLSRTDAKTK